MYINETAALPTLPRQTAKTSKRDFRTCLQQVMHMPTRTNTELYSAARCLIGQTYDNLLKQDLRYETYPEQITTNPPASAIGTPLTGLQTLKNGLTFYGLLFLQTDNPYPMFTLLYANNDNIRAYTPTHGNFVNTDAKCQLGMENEICGQARKEQLLRKYKRKYRRLDTTRLDELYLIQFGEIPETVQLNWDIMKQELEECIHVT